MSENEKVVIDELFDELKNELTFLPDIDMVREGFLWGFKWTLTQ